MTAGDDEGSGEVCGRVQSVPKAQELSRGSSEQVNAQFHTRETLEAH